MPLYRTVAEAIANVGNDFPENGFVFQDMKGNETRYLYSEMEKLTAQRAAGLQQQGLRKGDRLGMIIIEPEDFVLDFLAAVRIGVLPVPLYPPMSFGSLDAYSEKTRKILTTAGAKVLLCSGKLQNILWSLVGDVPSLETLLKVEDLRTARGTPVYPTIEPEDLCFLQYTSGSTSDPKGVMVTHHNLVVNNDITVHQHLKIFGDQGHTALSWLPLYHDMGLIGFVLCPVTCGLNGVQIPTMRFIRRPSVWLEACSRHKANASFAPNFAYSLAMRRVTDKQLAEWDLSSLTVLGCGAEPIQAETMRKFTELFHEHCNLPTTSIMAAYGMAEHTLAISLTLADEHFVTNLVDAETFQGEGRATAPIEGKTFIEHVGCGKAFPGHEVASLDENGNVLPDGVEGELCLRGDSVCPGYWENPEATEVAHRGDWLHTGDLGYLIDGEVYITGRLKDLIIVNGRNIHPQSIEWATAEVEGVRKGNVIAFSVPGETSEEVVLCVESRSSEPDALREAVRTHIQREMSLAVKHIEILKPSTLPKTSSGKLQRRMCRQQYLTGQLGTGIRATGGKGSTVTVAKHVAKSVWTRAKAAANLL